ncbi:SusC/RagA family TonB-linked outer membrane protein [Zhouia sp. PK063]|uniref:SusC/RagA family TonB-linked outer membrane protein n=1 Tax=Zhouia sp. PK063 TaxID=3373602 RepID=UPI00378A11F3
MKIYSNSVGCRSIYVIFLVTYVLFCSVAHAQNITQHNSNQSYTISGSVSDAHGRLAGVTVRVSGSRALGTFTNIDGEYSLSVTAKDSLLFSFVGYQTKKVPVGQVSHLDVVLVQDVTALAEVTVNAGYYTVSERERTGSIFRVSGEQLNRQPVVSPLLALQGRVPGLVISPVSGTPGVAPVIRIRGENSLRVQKASNTTIPNLQGGEGGRPLYVIDGIPVSSEAFYSVGGAMFDGGIDPLAGLNPQNIESIEVLKDADATAIYGSRGANGVILITTKRANGTKGKVSLHLYQGISSAPVRMQLLNTPQYLAMREEALANDGIDRTAYPDLINNILYPDLSLWDQNRYTDWQEKLMGDTAGITDLQGTVSGGSALTSYQFGGGYHTEGFVTPGDNSYQKATGHFMLQHQSANNRFKASVTANYGWSRYKISGDDITPSLLLELPPNAPAIYQDDGSLNWEIIPNRGIESWQNPLANLAVKTKTDTHMLTFNTTMGYRLLKGMEAKISFGYTTAMANEVRTKPLAAMAPSKQYNPATGRGSLPSMDLNRTDRNGVIVEPQLNYHWRWKAHRLDVLVGGTYQQEVQNRLYLTGEQYTMDAFLGSLEGAGTIRVRQDEATTYRYAAVYGRLGYGYKNRYMLNFTGRRDGSSRFGEGHRFGNFGAVGAAWLFMEEPWLAGIKKVVNYGKLRGSYGTTGNDQIGNYQYLDLYQLNTNNPYQGNMSLSPYALYNADFSWEKTKKLEFAVELGMFDQRLTVQGSWYRNRSSNQLVQYPLPYTTGFNAINKNLNQALIENSGWEFSLGVTVLKGDNLQWNINANLSVNRNTLVAFDGIADSPYATIFKVGAPLSVQRLYHFQGVDPQTGAYQIADMNQDGVINSEDRQFGNSTDKDFYGGISQLWRYKGFSLSALLQFSRGYARYLSSRMPGLAFNQPTTVLQRWQQEGDQTTVQRFSTQSQLNTLYGQYVQSDANWDDASFLRLKSVQCTYQFPDHITKKLGLSSAALIVQGQNLWTWTMFKGLDPETGYGAPLLRIVTAGLQLTF